MSKFRTTPLGAIAMAAVLAAMPATAEERFETGVLNCTVDGGIGLLLGSRKDMACTYEKNDGTVVQYTGRVTKIGVDLGITQESYIAWAVLAPTRNPDPSVLAGRYAGVSAEATAGAGVGANVLLGGGQDSIALQPISVQAQTGLNVAGGLQSMQLTLSE